MRTELRSEIGAFPVMELPGIITIPRTQPVAITQHSVTDVTEHDITVREVSWNLVVVIELCCNIVSTSGAGNQRLRLLNCLLQRFPNCGPRTSRSP